jgi:hypothetical protein
MKTKLLIIAGLLVIAFAAMIAPVMAGSTATITGNVAKTITVNVNGTITDWPLTSGITNTNSTSVTLDVSSNSPGWVVSIKDALDGGKPSAGHLVDYTGSTYGTVALGSALGISSASVTGLTGGSVAALSGSDSTIETGASDYTGAGTFTATPLTFSQLVAITDPVLESGHTYRIIVTFTGTTP